MGLAWILCIIGCFVVFCVTCWVMDRTHRKNLEEHERRMDEIYKHHRP
jgi:putative effector of murein hydrolase LrgA (UPF0299 family)